MRKLIMFATAVMALLAIPSIASADVPRCEASVPLAPRSRRRRSRPTSRRTRPTSSLNVWKHDFTVIVNADDTFTGTSSVSDNGGSFAWAEGVTGRFNADRTRISFDTVPVGGGATFQVTDAPYNVSVVVVTTWTANTVQMMISVPVFTSATTTTAGRSP